MIMVKDLRKIHTVLSLSVFFVDVSMYIVNMDTVLHGDLKKIGERLNDLDERINLCSLCGKPSLMHVGPSLRSEDSLPLNKMVELWNEFKRRIKLILKRVKLDRKNVVTSDSLFEGLKS